MPPAAAAMKNVFEGLGIPAMSAVRPSKFAGATVRHRKPASVNESSVWADTVGPGTRGAAAIKAPAASMRKLGRLWRCIRVSCCGVAAACDDTARAVSDNTSTPESWRVLLIGGGRVGGWEGRWSFPDMVVVYGHGGIGTRHLI